ncbi:IniB N-terminal domain-containing protein [Pseudonocardia abyssalis]|uniref:IniB N-terminal domain-containing protein n=1 Tax=Pseudonocardia abyssalis TaxID=2792008 RepID=A0ABS6V089_9PSEU|nr:IniB N-terminal domain-containing protein [Pseudonocardia abyssalis]MBW0116699.1 IniB N-terminal domain-containing protein [Pseudonocardia abyssalis]MBW0137910.1 IniB N-terminal domain-containing protein [Pseudonocardia abyssalis]
MLSLSSLIDFLLGLLRDEDAQAEFARDPQGVLARHDLAGITAQDVRDVQPMLADCDGVSYRGDGGGNDGGGNGGGGNGGGGNGGGGHRGYAHDDDPVRVIHHVTRSHSAEREVVREQHHDGPSVTTNIEYKQYTSEFHYTDNSVYVEDGGTYVRDSFNQDNDGVDNKGGVIDDSTVVVGDENTAGNTTETTVVQDSYNEEAGETVVIVDSLNDASDDSTTVTDSFDDSSTTAVVDTYAEGDSYAVVQQAPADAAPDLVPDGV